MTKPFPFKKSSQATSSDTSEIVDVEAHVVEEEPESETDTEEALEDGKPEESSKS